MAEKKYEIDISPSNNYYLHILKELNQQDILDIKQTHHKISIHNLFQSSQLINEIYKEQGTQDFILYNHNQESKSSAKYLSNNCLITIENDELSAKMRLAPNCSLNEIKKEIAKARISFGIIYAEIDFMIKFNRKESFVFAKGNPSISIEEASHELLFETIRPFPANIQQGNKGVYLDTTIENRTFAHSTIAKIHKGAQGQTGKTITGATIPTKLLPTKPITLGENVYEEKGEIKAIIDGLIEFNKSHIEVTPTLIIKEPLLNEKIDFEGTVIIENMIQNSTINATQDIIVYNTSNSTKLNADGYIYILTGFIGKSSKAKAKQGIFCGYAHNCSLTTTEGDINIGYESLHAHMDSAKSIYIERKASGGKLKARENIVMESSGSERITSKTDLSLDFDNNPKNIKSDSLINDIKSTERKYENAINELNRFKDFSKKSKEYLIKDPTFQKLTSIVFNLQEELKAQLLQLKEEETETEEKKHKSGRIIIRENIWNGTSITINDDNITVDKNANQASTFRQGHYGIIRERYEKDSDY